MSIWYAKAAVLAAAVVMIAIRAPHGQRSRGVKVASRHRGVVETALLTFAWISFLVPLAWIFAPWFDFAAYPLEPAAFACGVVLYVAGLWLFGRSHADLGTNWSITLELRAAHSLVTNGVYASVRHPMYTALLLFSLGQALVVPNWVAGPSYLIAMTLIVAFRVGPEERMMEGLFGAQYAEYRARTKRLLPGVG